MKPKPVMEPAKKCPTCGGVRHPKDNHGWMKRIKCQDRYHLWYCTNNYTREGCHGHMPGSIRCMDLG